MSGLKKAKKYDWKDSNMALVGSKEDKDRRKEVAQSEKAWTFTDFEGEGLIVFRINKFKVEQVPKCEYGNFFEGDSYIIFFQKKKPGSEDTQQDVYFWIGKDSTQDEYGTAAIKTIELDNYHDDKPIQHREVQGHESAEFRSHFSKLVYLKGGYDSGFNKVTPVEYKMRLFRVQKQAPGKGKKKSITVKQVAASKKALSEDDVFVLDKGDEVVQINGSQCSADEKYEARQYIGCLCDERCGKAMKLIVVDSMDEALTGYIPEVAEDEDDDDDDELDGVAEEFQPTMFRLSDASGSMKCEEVQRGTLSRKMLDPQGTGGEDVFICDFGSECIVWIGKHASNNEKANGMAYAHNYLRDTQHPYAPVSIMKCGHESREFLDKFH